MAANTVDYQNLQLAKTNSEKTFDEMISNLDAMRGQIVEMHSSTWKGSSSDVFMEIFEEVKTTLKNEREAFSNAMDQKLTTWYNEFDAAEKASIQAAQKL